MVALGSVPSFGSISAAFKLVRVHLCALQWGGPEKRRPRLPKAREKPDDERRKKQSQALPCSSPPKKAKAVCRFHLNLHHQTEGGETTTTTRKREFAAAAAAAAVIARTEREREEEISWNSALGDGNSGAGIPKKLNRTIIATI